MDPINSTYGSRSTIDPVRAFRARQQDAASSVLPAQGEDQMLPAQPVAGKSDVQLGIQSSGTAANEFLPYGPDGLQKKPTADVSVPVNKELRSFGSGDVKQEDPRIQQVVAQLKVTEEKVKAHEAAHKSGGAATGPISYTYTRGPDGKSYITGGEVPITISSGQTPQETISRMQQVIQAALAPADPSPQDRAVAAQATAMQLAARQEQTSSQPGNGGDNKTTGNTVTATAAEAAQGASISRQSRRAYSDPAVTGHEKSALNQHRTNRSYAATAGSGISNNSAMISSATADSGLSQIV